MTTPKKLEAHFNANKLRQDTWNALNTAARLLKKAKPDSEDAAAHTKKVRQCFELLEPVEQYWAFPGKLILKQLKKTLERGELVAFSRNVSFVTRALLNQSYRSQLFPQTLSDPGSDERKKHLSEANYNKRHPSLRKHYFEVLVVNQLTRREEEDLRKQMRSLISSEDSLIYDLVVVPSLQDALIAVLFNHNIQSCVIRYHFPVKSKLSFDLLNVICDKDRMEALDHMVGFERGLTLGKMIRKLRPELDLFLVTSASVEEAASDTSTAFRRIFYQHEHHHELHLSICKGIYERYQTPFFTALKEYSKRPTGVFHAMPLSRGNSVFSSHWIKDMGDFYGKNIFLAETSATTGGLDSLLHPTGPLKKALELAARAFGAQRTFFVTNGTSTANKIVSQALLQPDDIVLIDRDCHKSHHYSLVLAGARPVYLDSYPLRQFGMYGAVPLEEIKKALLAFKKAGRLDRVKMLILTNSTFDGMVHNTLRVMMEVLAIKPDMVFLWDEAWFGFAHRLPTYRNRNAMGSAKALADMAEDPAYRKTYRDFQKRFRKKDADDEKTWLDTRLLPDPDKLHVRVYATQSTHKTLSSLRQGSMIHVFDNQYKSRVENTFHEAFMTHTSTSPNYQILASLDISRRQYELEGYELVQRSLEMAIVFRRTLSRHKLLRRFFRVLNPEDMIPETYRASGLKRYDEMDGGWTSFEQAWKDDDFVLDPTRITLFTGDAGIEGDTFRKEYLMDEFGIQVNKTSRNTVLFMTNIGTSRSSIAFLIGVLIKIARKLERRVQDMPPIVKRALDQRVRNLTLELPPLPNFSRFHPCFREPNDPRGGNIRRAFFLAADERNCRYVAVNQELLAKLDEGPTLISASFITPYPPGFPILVPGQEADRDILSYMCELDVKEIHGYNEELGLRVLREEVLERESALTAQTTPAPVSTTAIPRKRKTKAGPRVSRKTARPR